jgi:hypothetical protein
MNKIQKSMLVICIILTIIGVSIWNMPDNTQSKSLNETTNEIVNQSNVINLEKPPFLVEVRP